MGDSGQGTVLPGQVQGVKEGNGVKIASDGTISFDPTDDIGVVKTNNTSAFNNYKWPGSKTIDAFLYQSNGTNNELNWIKRGLGIQVQDVPPQTPTLKLSVPTATTGPAAGTGAEEAVTGSLYWNTSSANLFIYVNDEWVQASYGPADLYSDLLTGTCTLYVNPEIGSDIYVTGTHSLPGDPGPVITNQMITAGYSAQKPFKTIERATLEVARIQNGVGQDSQVYDRYVIKCSTGVHTVGNGLGSTTVTAWENESVPSSATLQEMNTSDYAGVILPRGVSIIGEDLRKTVIRPAYVPPKTGDIETGRGSIFRVTGGAFFFNFTFKDKEGLESSHHLLDCFSLTPEADLTNYYSKAATIFDQDYPNQIVNPGETEIVAPKPPSFPDDDTDGTTGSSPYIFNCSVRSKYGLCGINADGSDVTGFKSMVVAQFTGVSLQKDLYCWQKYNAGLGTWTNNIPSYSSFISQDPNSLRMDPTRKHFHVRAINDAFIQEVSVFAIGQGIHHWSHSGGELSITNSNSSFGGCAALSEGYKGYAFSGDTNWNVGTVNLATNLTDQEINIKKIYLGTVDTGVANNSLVIRLSESLIESEIYTGVPEIVASNGYTLREDSYLWIENPGGPDWRSPLDSDAWVYTVPDEIDIKDPMENETGQFPGSPNSDLEGCKVYVRRMVDVRTVNQRRYSLDITNTDSNVRIPPRDYALQTIIGPLGNIQSLLPEADTVIVNKSGSIPVGDDPVSRKAQIVLQRANPDNDWTESYYYRPGDTVKRNGKHFTCVVQNSDAVFDSLKWSESYVHMPSEYNAYDFLNNGNPIVYFDNDTDGFEVTASCGYDLSTCWVTDTLIKNQYQTATDYRGIYQFLVGIGFTPEQVEEILVPRATADRRLDPDSSIDFPYTPDGAAFGLANWPVEFRRPSIVRLFSHAWEWAGYLNYTKALPEYQKDLSPQNQFNYYFTNNLGGRVYATGYNQEGYLVTAAGLTDLATGSTISLTELGNPFAGIEIPTYFPVLTVGQLTVESEVNFENGCTLNGSPIFSDDWYQNFRLATATIPGLIALNDIPTPPSPGGGEFPSGTKLSFPQASAPTGWTQVTTATLNDAAMRIVTSAGGGTGGSAGFSSTFTATRSTTISLVSAGSVQNHILSISQMPGHRHRVYDYDSANISAVGSDYQAKPYDFTTWYTDFEGGDQVHSHAFTNPTYSMGNMNFAVKYVNFIIASKN